MEKITGNKSYFVVRFIFFSNLVQNKNASFSGHKFFLRWPTRSNDPDVSGHLAQVAFIEIDYVDYSFEPYHNMLNLY